MSLSFRALTPFLVLMLAPILVVASSTQAAHAVTKNGPGVVFAFKDDSSLIPGNWLDCTATANWKRVDAKNPTIRITGGLCEDGWAASPTLEGGQDEALFAAACADTGEVFEFRTSTIDFENETGLPTFELRYLEDATGTIPNNCTVSAINWEIFDEGTGRDGHWKGSTTVNLGSPPPAVAPVDDSVPNNSVCTRFQPTGRPVATFYNGALVSGKRTYGIKLQFKGTIEAASAGKVVAVPIVQQIAATQDLPNATGQKFPLGGFTALSGLLLSDTGAYFYQKTTGGVEYQSPTDFYRVIGAQVAITGFPSANPDPSVFTGTGSAIGGSTDLSYCRYYFGEKWANDPNSTKDEPYAPMGGAGVPTDDPDPTPTNPAPVGDTEGGCDGFSFTDPTSWAGAGICVLVKAVNGLIDAVGSVVGLLGDVLAALGDLVSGIVDGILDGLAALFVPSDGFMDAKFGELNGTVDDSGVGQWKAAIDGGISSKLPGGGSTEAGLQSDALQTPSFTRSEAATTESGSGLLPVSSGGCEGPGVTWGKFELVGLPSTWHPIDACTGKVAEAAGWCRLMLTGFIGLFGFLKILGMLMVSLGFARNINTLTSFDWSGTEVGRLR